MRAASLLYLIALLAATAWTSVGAWPIKTAAGYVCVYDSDNELSGYVNRSFSDGLYTLTEKKSTALKVSIKLDPDNGLVALKATNNPTKAFEYVAFLVGRGAFNNGILAVGSLEYVYLGGSKTSTPSKSQPPLLPNSVASEQDIGLETTVWNYTATDPKTYNPYAPAHPLVPQWVNLGGDIPSPQITAYDPANKWFVLTGDLDQYQNQSEGTYPVTFALC